MATEKERERERGGNVHGHNKSNKNFGKKKRKKRYVPSKKKHHQNSQDDASKEERSTFRAWNIDTKHNTDQLIMSPCTHLHACLHWAIAVTSTMCLFVA